MMADDQTTFVPRVLSEEEIEMYLKSDRREVDRLILYSLNRLAASIIPLIRREEERAVEADRLLKELGGKEMMVKRSAYVDALITSSNVKSQMMAKVGMSSLTWALPIFFIFISTASWKYVVEAFRAALAIPK